MQSMKKFAVWRTYIGNWGEPEIVEARNAEEAIDAYPTWYQRAVMTWHVVEVKARSEIATREPTAEVFKPAAEAA